MRKFTFSGGLIAAHPNTRAVILMGAGHVHLLHPVAIHFPPIPPGS